MKITYHEVHELHSVHGDRGIGQRTLWGSADVIFLCLICGELSAKSLDKGDIACLVFVLIVCRLKINTKNSFVYKDWVISLPTSKPSILVLPNGRRPASKPVPPPKRFQSVDAKVFA